MRRSPSRIAGAARSRAVASRRYSVTSFMIASSKPHHSRDAIPLDLRRARVERPAHGVPELLLHAVLAHVAIAAVDLDGGERRLQVVLTGEQLRDGDVRRRVLVPLDAVAGAIEPLPRDLHADPHVDQLV